MSKLTKTHWTFGQELFNLTRHIGQISHTSEVDSSKNTCFEPQIIMDMSISKKKPVSQLKPFEKPCFCNSGNSKNQVQNFNSWTIK